MATNAIMTNDFTVYIYRRFILWSSRCCKTSNEISRGIQLGNILGKCLTCTWKLLWSFLTKICKLMLAIDLRKVLDLYFVMYISATAALYFQMLSWNDVSCLTSGLQESVNVHRGALLLVPQWECISSFVFYILDTIYVNLLAKYKLFGFLSKLLASMIRNYFPKRPSGAPLHTLSKLYDFPSGISPSSFVLL